MYSTGLLAAGSAKPPLQFRIDTLMFSLLIFVVLLFVLLKYAWKPIMEGLDAREKSIADEIENARMANEQAQAQAGEPTRRRLPVPKTRRQRSSLRPRSMLSQPKEKIMAEAAAEAQRTHDRAVAEIETAKNAAVRELAESSVDSAVSLAGNIVGRSLDKVGSCEIDRASQSSSLTPGPDRVAD